MKFDRHLKMKQLFLQKHNLTNQELCDHFGISIETVRRDLAQLEKEGVIRRVYGGAVLSDDNVMPETMPPFSTRAVTNRDEKAAIAREVLAHIPDNATIAMDSGTTMLELAKLLNTKQNLTILTNAMHVALELSSSTTHLVYFVGGAIKRDEMITTGFLSNFFMEYFSHIDLAVLSSDGFNVNVGVSDCSVEMGTLKKSMIERADRVLVVADHSKFGKDAFFKVCGLSEIDEVVTGAKAPAAAVETMKSAGIKVTCVEI